MTRSARCFMLMPLLALSVLASSACGAASPSPSPTPSLTSGVQDMSTPARAGTSLLRIVNSGRQDIVGLVVLFPPSHRVEFGDVPAGQATEYREVPGGVYRYAAYEYAVDGRVAKQPVVDWVGEGPMPGSRFTYRVAFDAAQRPGTQIRLVEVEVDER
jgi:hypothetical protein